MATDNHTTIVGNLVEDPEVRVTNTGIAVTNLRVAVTQRIQQDLIGATATPRSSRSTCGAARPNTWPTPSPRATGSWSPAGSANGPGRPLRGRSGRSPS
jgi:hypothetical protein